MKKLMNYYITLLFICLFVSEMSKINAQSLPSNFILNEKRLNKAVDNLPNGNSADRILIQDKNTIWLGTSKGLSKSSDNGASWKNFYNSKEFGTESISAIAYDGINIWAATWHMENSFGIDAAVGTGLKYSSNGGDSWIVVEQPKDAKTDTLINYGSNKIKIVPRIDGRENFILGIAFHKNAIWIASKLGGLRKSSDKGNTWERVVLPPDNIHFITPKDKYTFFIDPQKNLSQQIFSIFSYDENTLLVGSAGGVLKTTDNGLTWNKFTSANQNKPICGNHIWTISKSPFDSSIWITSWLTVGEKEFNGVCVSKDIGDSWEIFLSEEKARDFAFKPYYNQNAIIHNDILVAAEGGVYRSNNFGKTWIAAPRIIDSKTKLVLKQSKFLSVETNMLNNTDAEIWIGSDDGTAKTTEVNTTSWNDNWKLFISSSGSVAKSESFAFPNPFQPSKEVVRIKYSLENAATVTLRIFDFGMNLVKTVLQNASRTMNSEQLDYWDGKDESNQIVTNGVYFYRLDIEGKEAQFGKIMVIR